MAKYTLKNVSNITASGSLSTLGERYDAFMDLFSEKHTIEDYQFYSLVAAAGIVLNSSELFKGAHKLVEGEVKGDEYKRFIDDFTAYISDAPEGESSVEAATGSWIILNMNKPPELNDEFLELAQVIGYFIFDAVRTWGKLCTDPESS